MDLIYSRHPVYENEKFECKISQWRLLYLIIRKFDFSLFNFADLFNDFHLSSIDWIWISSQSLPAYGDQGKKYICNSLVSADHKLCNVKKGGKRFALLLHYRNNRPLCLYTAPYYLTCRSACVELWRRLQYQGLLCLVDSNS